MQCSYTYFSKADSIQLSQVVQLLSKDEASEVRFYCEYELLDKDFFGSFSFDLRFCLSKS